MKNIDNLDMEKQSSLQCISLNLDKTEEIDDKWIFWKLNKLVDKTLSSFDKKKDDFIRDIFEVKDRLWFWVEAWRCMMQVEYLIEWNSRNKAMCVAFIDQDLNLEKIDFSEKTPELA